MSKKDLWVACPICGQKFKYYESEFRPFCREKCQLIDLGKWLEGDYAIPCEGTELSSHDEENGEDEGENK